MESSTGHLEVIAGELLHDGSALHLPGVADDVERVDEGIELLHREVVGDECLGALCETGDGELHCVVVQIVDLKARILVVAADIGHCFHFILACAVE